MPTNSLNTHPILPWNNQELEQLLRELIAHGTETAKVDFKSEIEAALPEQKADLLKDITAIGNTYDNSNNDHGFLIYGVKGKTIGGIKQTEIDTDKLQNQVEQLLRSYISPMPDIYVVSFVETTGERWGSIIIPPRNSKPYMFVKDLQCTDPKRTRRRGDWFVRRGATTDIGLPEDLALITQRQTELLLEPLRESVRSLQSRVVKVEDAYNSALFDLVKRTVSGFAVTAERSQAESEELGDGIGGGLGMDLSTRFKQSLRRSKDPLAEDLIAEARSLSGFLASSASGLPWAPQPNNSVDRRRIIENLEERTRSLQLSVATIVLHDNEDVFTEALVRALKILAKEPEVPTGTTFNSIGEGLRYYPLGLLLYTTFVCGVLSNRGNLLKLISAIPLKATRPNVSSPITNLFFHWYGAKGFFNESLGQRWCEPTAQRIRQVINDNIGEAFVEVSEPDAFFQGEFVLALVNIDAAMTNGSAVEHRVPIPGLYLYAREAQDPIANLLTDSPAWLEKLYDNPLIDLLKAFDQNARQVADPNCFWFGLPNAASIYLKAREKRTITG